jgi:hypothetical protein
LAQMLSSLCWPQNEKKKLAFWDSLSMMQRVPAEMNMPNVFFFFHFLLHMRIICIGPDLSSSVIISILKVKKKKLE